MIITSNLELEILRESGKRLAGILHEIKNAVRPGISTQSLDDIAERLIDEMGGDPVFKGYKTYGSRGAYPACVCTSVNEEIVHGIPKKDRILQEGDIVGLDIGIRYPKKTGLITDMAVTVAVGKISDEAKALLQATEESLHKGIAAAMPGGHIGDIGAAVSKHLKQQNYGIIRELVGHGVGKKLHEDPYVPNYGIAGEGERLMEGMVLALEPMATEGSPKIKLDEDGWTYKTKDGKLSAHFEHTIALHKGGAEILTKME